MSGESNIGWTDRVWNPTTGCSRVSPGCEHCYAETLSLRRGWSKQPWTNQNAAENVVLHPDRLVDPLRWRKPARVFVNSMSDLFHEQIPDEFIADVFAVMSLAKHHTYQVLTKRPARMLKWFTEAQVQVSARIAERIVKAFHRKYGRELVIETEGPLDQGRWPLPNVWLGVSVEDQRRADERIAILLETPAAVRWISAEPLLGHLDIADALWRRDGKPALDWVVVGGESGPGHRPMDPLWLYDLVEQCDRARVPVFVKQDSGPKPGKQRRIGDVTWARKEYPR